MRIVFVVTLITNTGYTILATRTTMYEHCTHEAYEINVTRGEFSDMARNEELAGMMTTRWWWWRWS